MGRIARIVLVLVGLALVFAPRASTMPVAEGARQLTAAVLAPTTGDADAVAPARERDTAPALLALLLLATVATLVAVPRPARLALEHPHHLAERSWRRRPRRRGPPPALD